MQVPMKRSFGIPPIAFSLALIALVFAIDLMLPLGVASAVPYTFAVLLALADRRHWVGPAVAVLCCILTVLKMQIAPDRGTTEEWKVIANRCLAIFSVSITTVLGILRKRAAAAQARAEEQLKVQQAALAHVGRLSMLGQVAAGLAHELNQPLAAIGLQAEVAARMAIPGATINPELAEILREIAAQSARAGEIVRGVRRMARGETPGTDPMAIDDAITSALAILDWQAQKAGVAVGFVRGGPVAIVAGNRVQIEQVLINLIQNAFDAVADQPRALRNVSVAVEAEKEFVTIRVRDSGPGGYDDARLFEPFYTTKEGGLGLGLAISRGIVQAHGGRMWVQPDGAGTEFAFSLPRAQSDSP